MRRTRPLPRTPARVPAPGHPRSRRIPRLATALALALLIVPAASLAQAAQRQGRWVGVTIRSPRHVLRLRAGEVVRFPVRVFAWHGYRGPLALRIVGLPRGADARLRPRAVRPTHRATVIVRTSRATRAGTYRIAVIADAATFHGVRLRPGSPRIRPRSQLSLRFSVLARPDANGERRGQDPSTSSPPAATGSTTATTSDPPPSTTASPPATTTTTATQSGPGDPASVPSHVPTWAYDDGCNGGSGASASLVRQWLTYAESNCGPRATKAMSDCVAGGVSYCTPVAYLDTGWIYATGSVPIAADASESWWLHRPGYTDSAHRVYINANGGGNILNDSVAAVQGWFQGYLRTNYDEYPALMMDDSGPSLSSTLWGTGLTSTQEITSDAQLQASHEAMAGALTHSDGTPYLQIDNGLNPNVYLAQPFGMLNHPDSVRGLVAEGSPISFGTLTNYYSSLLDSLAYVDATANDFIVLLSYDNSASARARRVQAATELLGYDGEHVVSWSDLERDSGDLSVWPEEGIVPTEPLQSMSPPGGSGCLAGVGVICSQGGHHDLEVAPGVYRREFADCYDQGIPFGPCAAIVNTTGSPVTIQRSWLSQPYGHEITFDGGDVQSGGTVNLAGAPFVPGTTTVPADDAALLAP